MAMVVDVPQTAQIVRRLSFSDEETQNITASLGKYTAPTEKCYEIERQLVSYRERLRPLKFKLKHLLSKQLFCERLMQGGQTGYESIIPDTESLDHAQAFLQKLREEKKRLREDNNEMSRELSTTIERILSAQMELQDTLHQLSTLGEDSPYIPSQAVSHLGPIQTSADRLATQQDREAKLLKMALTQLETRIKEIEDHQLATVQVYGLSLTQLEAQEAVFSLDLTVLLGNKDGQLLSGLLDTHGVNSDTRVLVSLSWDQGFNLTNVQFGPESKVNVLKELLADCLEAGMEDNSPSFILRETVNRLVCVSKRTCEIENLKLNLEGVQNLIGVQIDNALSLNKIGIIVPNRFTAELNVPWEYPNVSARIITVENKTSSSAVPSIIQEALENKKRFGTISETFNFLQTNF